MKKNNVLLISPDPKLISIARYWLSLQGVNVCSINRASSLARLRDFDFRVILFDDSFAKSVDLFYLIKKVKTFIKAPLILLTNKKYTVENYFFGVDQVILKPLSLRSINVVLFYTLTTSRRGKCETNFFKVSRLTLHKNQVFFNGKLLPLTSTEYKILSLLLEQDYLICHKSFVLEQIWGYQDPWSLKSNIVEMHISKLKRKFINTPYKISLRKKGEFFLLTFYHK